MININNSYVSFKSRYPLNYETTERIIKDYVSLGLKSATEYEMRLPQPLQTDPTSNREFYFDSARKKIYLDTNNNTNNYIRKKQLLTQKISSIQNFIDHYRYETLPQLYYETEEDYYLALKEIVKKYKTLNCYECAVLMHYELNKLGIENKIVSDLDIDHCFVVVNRKEPFVTYNDRKSGEFIADLWLKNTYKSVQEAQIDFSNRIKKTSKANLLVELQVPPENVLNRPLTKKEKAHNEKLLDELEKIGAFLDKKSKEALTNGKFEYFKITTPEEIIQNYTDNLALLNKYFTRNLRKKTN